MRLQRKKALWKAMRTRTDLRNAKRPEGMNAPCSARFNNTYIAFATMSASDIQLVREINWQQQQVQGGKTPRMLMHDFVYYLFAGSSCKAKLILLVRTVTVTLVKN